MTREDFIRSNWLSYPHWPPPLGQWRVGRIVELLSQSVTLLHNGSSVTITAPRDDETRDPYLGKSIPLQFLLPGDIVAVPNDGNALYLLSPNLTGAAPEADHHGWQAWPGFVAMIDGYLLAEQFCQARTPYLVPCPGVDHHIDFLRVRGSTSQQEWFLPTSPEIHLKKLLCRGLDKVYEIKTCFRDDFIGPHHQKEFTMAEWYRAYGSLEDLKADIINIGKQLADHFPKLHWDQVPSVTVRELFDQHLDFNLTPLTTLAALKKLAEQQQVEFLESDSWNEIFYRLWLARVEPRLGQTGPVFVEDFPPSMASLARIKNSWAQRFEFYWQGVELANAYVEENSPAKNEEIFLLEARQRHESGKPLCPLDVEFFTELKRGMPPAVGVAMGLDRLFALAMGENHLQQTRPFPLVHQD